MQVLKHSTGLRVSVCFADSGCHQASYSTAKSATKYAQGEYTKFSVAVTEGEKQYAEDAVKYDTERTQLLNEKPALQEVSPGDE
mmetsp:Transcript_19175/g.29961  ORF Transcript_19175/g.29961 Transcript_19175/m.29961 type:complete len:84 (-) Transcript_19175:28-279(-)